MFTTRPVRTQTFSEHLVSLRERLNLSLADAARFSQVQPKYLKALEEGRFADLPAQVYIKGFLNSLARVYRVEAGAVFAEFLAEYAAADNQDLLVQPRKEKFAVPWFVWSPKTITLAGLAVLGLVSISFLYFQVSSLTRPPALSMVSPATDGTVDSSLLVVEGKTEVGAAVYLNNQPILVDANGNFRENLSLAPGSNKLAIKSVNKFGKETVVTRQVLLAEKEIAGAFAAATSTPLTSGLNLEIKVGPEPAWVNIQRDDMEDYAGTMLAGTAKKIMARDKVILSTSNAGSTRVNLNGKDLGVMGKKGETLRDVEFTK